MIRICHRIEKRDTIPDVVIHREDLERVIESFRRQELPVTISDRLSEFADIEDVVRKRGSRPDEIKIYSYSEKHGSVSVLFSADDARIYAMGDDVARGVYRELNDLLSGRHNWKKHFCKLKIWFVFVVSALTAESVLVFMMPIRGEVPWLLHTFLWGVIVAWMLFRVCLRFLPMIRLGACVAGKTQGAK